MEQKKYKERTCNKCGWVHFAVTREHAENEVKKFNEFFDSLTEEQREDSYGGRRSTMKEYENCFFCGNTYEDFRDAKEDDCPIGVTLGPIIEE
jgi:protein-arginine kinase activator protein McsA